MPIRAIVNSEAIFPFALSDWDWHQFVADVESGKKKPVLPCCGDEGRPRTSAYNIRYFNHATKTTCAWNPERKGALLGKTIILESCRAKGSEATSEVVRGSFYADVVVQQDKKAVAFQVYPNGISQEAFLTLEQAARAVAIPCCWLVGKVAENSASASRAVFRVSIVQESTTAEGSDVPSLIVHVGSHSLKLRKFVQEFLGKRIRFSAAMKSLPVRVLKLVFFHASCNACGKSVLVYGLKNPYTSRCNSPMLSTDSICTAGTQALLQRSFSLSIEEILNKSQIREWREFHKLAASRIVTTEHARRQVVVFDCPYCLGQLDTSSYEDAFKDIETKVKTHGRQNS